MSDSGKPVHLRTDLCRFGLVTDRGHFYGWFGKSRGPLRIGWGIRGRVFEVMALGVPVVATPVAVDGMGLEDGEGILMARTPAEFTDIVARLLIDAPWRQEVGERGRRVAVQKASIGATYDRLAAFLRDRVAAGAGHGGPRRAPTARPDVP